MATTRSQACIPLLKALADETRWRLVHELLARPLTVTQLTERLGASQYNISKHLRILQHAGIVQKRRMGKLVECRVTPSFRRRLNRSRAQLDLGCCNFRI